MAIVYKQVPGKELGLHFEDVSSELAQKAIAFVELNARRLDARFHEQSAKAHPFIQGMRIEEGKDSSWLFIEFWSPKEKHAEYIRALLGILRKLVGCEHLVIEGFAA